MWVGLKINVESYFNLKMKHTTEGYSYILMLFDNYLKINEPLRRYVNGHIYLRGLQFE